MEPNDTDGPCGQSSKMAVIDSEPGVGKGEDWAESGLVLSFRKLQGTATLDRYGNVGCIVAGLDGAPLRLQQDMRINIDHTNAGLTGQTRGSISLEMVDGSTRRLQH
jgi:hypothetical protein